MFLRFLLIILILLEQVGWGVNFRENIEKKLTPQEPAFLSVQNNLLENVDISPLPKKIKKGDPIITGESAMVIDFDTSEILYTKNNEKKMAPASLAKIMTAILILEEGNLNDKVKISSNAVKTEGWTLELVPGEQVDVKNLLYGMLIVSSNDASVALAEYLDGTVYKFVKRMNKKAKEIGLLNTHFENPSGLDSKNQYSTAKDLAFLTKYALGNPVFAKIVKRPKFKFVTVSGRSLELANTNWLLLSPTYKPKAQVLGVKTGQTNKAGECLISAAEKNGHKIICVVLKSQDRFLESKNLINWAYDSYSW